MGAYYKLNLGKRLMQSLYDTHLQLRVKMFVNLVYDDCTMSVLVRLVTIHHLVKKGATESYVNHNAHQASIAVREEIGAHLPAVAIMEEHLTVIVPYVYIVNDATSLTS